MGDILSIISREAEKRPRYKAFNFNDTKIEQFSDAYRTASWAKDRAKRARRIERWKKGRVRFTEQVQAFGLSRSLFDHGPQISWECTDILGKGAFGLVGLWQQLEADGRVIDSVAVKEVEGVESLGRAKQHDGNVLPMEAVAMNEMRKAWSVVGLRDFVCLRKSRGNSFFRLYQEYCANGSIRDLIQVYREYNRRHEYDEDHRKIPEVYIWYMFLGFAIALREMEQPDFRTTKHPPGKPCVLHLDLKDVNVLLAAPFKHRHLSNYPVVKVCDWGLAQLTSERDPQNSTRFAGNGTAIWDPPEQKFKGDLCRHWRRNPFGYGDYPPYLVQHSMWQMAAIIFCMMEQDKNNEKLDSIVQRLEVSEDVAWANGMKLFEPGARDEAEGDYSIELWKLVRDCLMIDPRLRPSVNDLKWRAEKGLEKLALKMLDLGTYTQPPKVFFAEGGDVEKAVAEMERFYLGTARKEQRGDPYGVERRRRSKEKRRRKDKVHRLAAWFAT